MSGPLSRRRALPVGLRGRREPGCLRGHAGDRRGRFRPPSPRLGGGDGPAPPRRGRPGGWGIPGPAALPLRFPLPVVSGAVMAQIALPPSPARPNGRERGWNGPVGATRRPLGAPVDGVGPRLGRGPAPSGGRPRTVARRTDGSRRAPRAAGHRFLLDHQGPVDGHGRGDVRLPRPSRWPRSRPSASGSSASSSPSSCSSRCAATWPGPTGSPW